MDNGKKILLLVDGHALLYRAFFGYPASLTLESGQMVNAVYGFTRLLLGAINELHPTHLAVSFDVGKTFRHESYAEYKAHREKMPAELKSQEPITTEILAALNIPIYTNDGFEADDVIGTLAKQAEAHNKDKVNIIIMTGDRDMWQLVTDIVNVYAPPHFKKPSRIINPMAVKTILGVHPKQIPDYKGLCGDASDNIKGVKGVGLVTAAKLICEYGEIEKLYEAIGKGQTKIKAGLLTKLIEGETAAFESKKLTTIVTNVPIKLDWEHTEIRSYDKGKAVEVMQKYKFKSLIPLLPTNAFEEDIRLTLFN